MGKYLKEFELTSQYEEYINSTIALLPNVSLTNDDNMVHYNHKVTTPSIMSFNIDSTSYQAEEGMTWEEWVNSEYNTSGFILRTNSKSIYGIYNSGKYVQTHTDITDDIVSAYTEIQFDTQYYLVKSMPL